ncbi:MAG: sulfide/dihydroorotate dehydrogenase-like FAD/NAD-binding protein [Chitinivibrionales bacterium]|nr:sulfide/dihydroorotate dehydrogenase-like FAD/NAD-binding protein [Chitinivibrionales bacterium]MBD3394278.1 sulfide/dihydroorotate dehydrogenase-like FAD/NAD-binding protein [Chitinivibrionales bacterium]
MARLLSRDKLSPLVWRYRIDAPRIARKHRAGQFVILRPVEGSERIPLTIANADPGKGWIEIIFQVVGKTTARLSHIRQGEEIADIVGPLGRPTHVEKFGRALCIGGGVGAAPLYPIVRALHDAGNHVTTIIGARNKDLLMLENEMREASDRLLIATDDGSEGHHGFVSDVFNSLVAEGEAFDVAMVIGPVIMMKVTTSLTVAQGIRTYASLNPIMVDGTGMCGGCRVTVEGKTRFACVDGPEFDASGIDWDELIKRLSAYRQFESQKNKDHECKLAGL